MVVSSAFVEVLSVSRADLLTRFPAQILHKIRQDAGIWNEWFEERQMVLRRLPKMLKPRIMETTSQLERFTMPRLDQSPYLVGKVQYFANDMQPSTLECVCSRFPDFIPEEFGWLRATRKAETFTNLRFSDPRLGARDPTDPDERDRLSSGPRSRFSTEDHVTVTAEPEVAVQQQRRPFTTGGEQQLAQQQMSSARGGGSPFPSGEEVKTVAGVPQQTTLKDERAILEANAKFHWMQSRVEVDRRMRNEYLAPSGTTQSRKRGRAQTARSAESSATSHFLSSGAGFNTTSQQPGGDGEGSEASWNPDRDEKGWTDWLDEFNDGRGDNETPLVPLQLKSTMVSLMCNHHPGSVLNPNYDRKCALTGGLSRDEPVLGDSPSARKERRRAELEDWAEGKQQRVQTAPAKKPQPPPPLVSSGSRPQTRSTADTPGPGTSAGASHRSAARKRLMALQEIEASKEKERQQLRELKTRLGMGMPQGQMQRGGLIGQVPPNLSKLSGGGDSSFEGSAPASAPGGSRSRALGLRKQLTRGAILVTDTTGSGSGPANPNPLSL